MILQVIGASDFPPVEVRQGNSFLVKLATAETRTEDRQKPCCAGFLPHQCGIPGALTAPPL
jgi:hypothetical protein